MVTDESTLTGVFQSETYLPVGIEGEMAVDGDATYALPEQITSAADAATAFGTTSSLTSLVQLLLSRGYSKVTAVASEASHDLAGREAAWEALEDDDTIRLRLTDSTVQADMAALADSCENAESIQNKQFCVLAMGTPSSKSTLSTIASAIASKRAVLVGPGIYDLDANLLGGGKLAAVCGAEIAKNPDITDSLNLYEIPATAGLELEAASGLPLFRLHANSGSPIDDFQDLLDDGVSPLKQADSGLAAFTHIRTTWTEDDTFDALQTLLVKDEVFIGLRSELLSNNFLRKPNTSDNRKLAAAIVDAWLKAHDTWVAPVSLTDGSTGYGVTTAASTDGKKFTVSYKGEVVRGTNVIAIDGVLTIPS